MESSELESGLPDDAPAGGHSLFISWGSRELNSKSKQYQLDGGGHNQYRTSGTVLLYKQIKNYAKPTKNFGIISLLFQY